MFGAVKPTKMTDFEQSLERCDSKFATVMHSVDVVENQITSTKKEVDRLLLQKRDGAKPGSDVIHINVESKIICVKREVLTGGDPHSLFSTMFHGK